MVVELEFSPESETFVWLLLQVDSKCCIQANSNRGGISNADEDPAKAPANEINDCTLGTITAMQNVKSTNIIRKIGESPVLVLVSGNIME